MLEPPQISASEEQLAAVIHLTTPRNKIVEVMDPAVQELLATLAEQGRAPAGAMFSHHLAMDPETFDFELGFPVTAEVTAAGRVRPGRLPAATVARAVYHGPYEGLAEAWGQLHGWISAAGHTPGTGLWERYLVGPESGDDPAHWRTELNRPLAALGS